MSSPRLPLSSRQTFLPDEISKREFATVFRGYDPAEVRTFLNQMAEQAAETSDRIAEVQHALVGMEERAKNPELTEEMVTSLLGEQTAQILRSAREAANDIRAKAEEEVGRQLRDAHEVTTRMKEEAQALLVDRTAEAERLAEATRGEAASDAESMRRQASEEAASVRAEVASESERRRAELEADLIRMREQAEREMHEELTRARQQARDLIDTARVEAQALVDRTEARQAELVEGLVRKRAIALAQVEELRAGRQRLLKAYKLVRNTLDEVTVELERVEDEARQAAALAGQRAAASGELSQEDLDSVIALESYSLDDDVPQRVIDLVEGRESDESGEFTFDLAEGDDDNAEPLESATSGEAPSSGGGGSESAACAPVATLQREALQGDEALEVESSSGPTSFIIGEAYVAADGDDLDRALQARRDAIVGKARSQALRRLKRALQDEQEMLVARLRSGDGKSVQALLGSAEDHAATYHRAVVKLLREVVRTGASSVEGSHGVERGVIDRTGTSAARGLADELVSDLRGQLQPIVEGLLTDEVDDVELIQQRVADPYRAVKGEYLEHLVEDRVGGVFDQGVAFARQGG